MQIRREIARRECGKGLLQFLSVLVEVVHRVEKVEHQQLPFQIDLQNFLAAAAHAFRDSRHGGPAQAATDGMVVGQLRYTSAPERYSNRSSGGTSSRMSGVSCFELPTFRSMRHIFINSLGNGFIRSAGSGSSPSQRP